MIESQEQKGLPIWLSGLVILISLSAGGALLWWLLSDAKPGGEIVITPPPPNPGLFRPGPGQRRPNPVADDIVQTNKDNWTVSSGRGVMRIAVANGKPTYRFNYNQTSYATPEVFQLNMLGRNVVNDPALAKKIAATPEQIEKLKVQNTPIGMRMNDADRQKLIGLWNEFKDAGDKNPAKQKLLAALKDIAERSLPATKSAVEERAKFVKSVFSEDQLNRAAQP